MTRINTLWITFVATLLLAATIVGVLWYTPQANAGGFVDTTSAVLFITGAAIAIERLLEAMWTFLGGVVGTYWPMNAVRQQVDHLVEDLDLSLRPFHAEAQANLAELQQQGRLTKSQLDTALTEITRFKDRFEELRKLAPNNQRLQMLAMTAQKSVQQLEQRFGNVLPSLRDMAASATTVIDAVFNFVKTFQDNPGRRLISIYLGAILGLGVAGYFGLDVFQAVLKTPTLQPWNVVFTGVLIGLGSNPTHEVIRAIQEYKQSRKGENLGRPNLP